MSQDKVTELLAVGEVGAGWELKVRPAWHVTHGVAGPCVIVAPILVTAIDRSGGFVKWRVPNQPLDIERITRFETVFSKLESAMAAATKLLEGMAVRAPNELQDHK